MLIQHALPGKEREGSSFRASRWNQQNLTFAFKNRAGNMPVYRLDEGNRSILQHNVQVFPIDGNLSDFVDIGSAQYRIEQLAINSKRRILRGGADEVRNCNRYWRRSSGPSSISAS